MTRKYNINQTFFDDIVSEDRAYFLGLLYADGSNDCKNNRVLLKLQEQDKPHLEKLSSLIYENRPLRQTQVLYKYKGKEILKKSFCIVIDSKHISNRLSDLGCGQDKSFKIRFPDYLNPELCRHFIRGYFDGDGCVSYGDKYRKVSFCGNFEFLSSLKNYLLKEIKVKGYLSKLNKNSNVYQLQYATFDSFLKLKNYFYEASSLYLERKFNKFINFSFI